MENPFDCDLDNPKQTGDLWLNFYLWSERWGGSETEFGFQECPGPKCKLRRSPPLAGTGTRTRNPSSSSPLHTSSCRSDGPGCPGGLGSLCWWRSPVLIPDPKPNKSRRDTLRLGERLILNLWLPRLWFQRRKNEVWEQKILTSTMVNYMYIHIL